MEALQQHPLVMEAVRLGTEFVGKHGQTGKKNRGGVTRRF